MSWDLGQEENPKTAQAKGFLNFLVVASLRESRESHLKN
jgi:hypothetical protein